MRSIWDRLWEQAVPRPSGCWEWSGARTAAGYGQLLVLGRMQYAHRLAYRLLAGPTPSWLQIDHLCRNRACVNPAHMELVTNQENAQRGNGGVLSGAQQRAKTQCPQGHLYNPENTYIDKRGWRMCRTCGRERMRRQRAR